MKYINESNFDEEISNGRVLVDFYADWCGPCKMMSPILDDFSKTSEIEVKKINVDNNPHVARKYGIMSIPTLILFENGMEVKKHVGYLTLNEVQNIFK